MIVLGAGTHKRSHTIAAVAAATGGLWGEKTVAVGARGFASLLVWAPGLEGERVWALEDCRPVAGAFERFLIARGERVLRVPTKLMAGARRGGRARGKSDSLDSVAVARAAFARRPGRAAGRTASGPELDIRLLVDHRERLVGQRVALTTTMQWHLHDSGPTRAARRRVVLSHVGQPDRSSSSPQPADDAGPDRPRRAAPRGTN